MIRVKNKHILARQNRQQRYIIREWAARLKGVPAFILGNAPSIKDEPIHLLENYFTVGINRAFLLLDPTVLMWQDIGLWNTEHQKLHNLQCLKVCRDVADPRHIYYNFYLRGGPFQFDRKTHILYGRGSTGPLAVQFAVALGCRPIVCLGMDCKKSDDGKTDFYGVNPHWRPTTLQNCENGLHFLKKYCPAPIINCSNTEILGERRKLEEVISSIDKKYAVGRQGYVRKLVYEDNKLGF